MGLFIVFIISLFAAHAIFYIGFRYGWELSEATQRRLDDLLNEDKRG